MIYLACPVMDGQDLTRWLMESLIDTVANPQSFTFVIVDNGSEPAYSRAFWEAPSLAPFPIKVISNEENIGYYRPMLQISEMATSGDIVGLCHNDIRIYDKGWDNRVRESFVAHGDMGLLGFVGSDEVDGLGGRGGGTMCFFRGARGQNQSAGRRVRDLHPACLLDSVVMFARQNVVHHLDINDDTPICHFVDKIWPMRLLTHQIKTGVLGVEMDHMGGMTAVANPRYHESARAWCSARGIDVPDPGSYIYQHAESLFLSEFRDQRKMIPGRMVGWNFVSG